MVGLSNVLLLELTVTGVFVLSSVATVLQALAIGTLFTPILEDISFFSSLLISLLFCSRSVLIFLNANLSANGK